MSSPASAASRGGGAVMTGLVALIERAIVWLERVPYGVLALPLRFAIATVFWNSGTAHIANWDATSQLFEDEYKVPLLPPEFAAHLAVGIELSTPVLLVLGLFTRPAVLVLLGMTAVIEVFVYPQAWPTHIQWVAMMLVLLCRGAGTFSLDYLLRRWIDGLRAPR